MVTPDIARAAAFAVLQQQTPYTLADLPMAAPAMGVAAGAALDAFPLVPFEGALYAVRPLDSFDGPPAPEQMAVYFLRDGDKPVSFWFGPALDPDELRAMQNELPPGVELDACAIAVGVIRAATPPPSSGHS